VKWNPVSPLIVATRDWITVGTTAHLPGFLIVVSLTLLCLFAGWILYRLALPHLIERIGN
jgi:lipopolysaccharide transport system permease protein